MPELLRGVVFACSNLASKVDNPKSFRQLTGIQLCNLLITVFTV